MLQTHTFKNLFQETGTTFLSVYHAFVHKFFLYTFQACGNYFLTGQSKSRGPPFEEAPLNPARSAISSLQLGLGRSPSQNRIRCILGLKSDSCWQQFQWFCWESTDLCTRKYFFPKNLGSKYHVWPPGKFPDRFDPPVPASAHFLYSMLENCMHMTKIVQLFDWSTMFLAGVVCLCHFLSSMFVVIVSHSKNSHQLTWDFWCEKYMRKILQHVGMLYNNHTNYQQFRVDQPGLTWSNAYDTHSTNLHKFLVSNFDARLCGFLYNLCRVELRSVWLHEPCTEKSSKNLVQESISDLCNVQVGCAVNC